MSINNVTRIVVGAVVSFRVVYEHQVEVTAKLVQCKRKWLIDNSPKCTLWRGISNLSGAKQLQQTMLFCTWKAKPLLWKKALQGLALKKEEKNIPDRTLSPHPPPPFPTPCYRGQGGTDNWDAEVRRKLLLQSEERYVPLYPESTRCNPVCLLPKILDMKTPEIPEDGQTL